MIQNGGGLTDSASREPAHAEQAEQDADPGADRREHEHFGEMLAHDAVRARRRAPSAPRLRAGAARRARPAGSTR